MRKFLNTLQLLNHIAPFAPINQPPTRQLSDYLHLDIGQGEHIKAQYLGLPRLLGCLQWHKMHMRFPPPMKDCYLWMEHLHAFLFANANSVHQNLLPRQKILKNSQQLHLSY